MNVFAVDPCPKHSAEALADVHVISQTKESAQILSTVRRQRLETGILQPACLPSHGGHPVVVAAATLPNFRVWVALHGLALAEEFRLRRGKEHAYHKYLEQEVRVLGLLTDDVPLPLWPQAMPEEHKRHADPHAAYRGYLRAKYEAWVRDKTTRVAWSGRNPPAWLADLRKQQTLFGEVP